MTKRNHIIRPFGAVLFGILLGCQPTQTEEEGATPYFDLEGLLTTQVQSLVKQNPQLNKATFLDEESDEYAVTLDKNGWEQELKFFFDADINQPILLDAYTTVKKGNYTQYMSMELGKNGVQSLTVNQGPEGIASISATTQNNNALYKGQRDLRLTFDGSGTELRLIGYEIEGYQKMIMKDTVSYAVRGTLVYD